jgi:hypothetical protein
VYQIAKPEVRLGNQKKRQIHILHHVKKRRGKYDIVPCKGMRMKNQSSGITRRKTTCRRKAKMVITTRKIRICEERKTGERQKGER